MFCVEHVLQLLYQKYVISNTSDVLCPQIAGTKPKQYKYLQQIAGQTFLQLAIHMIQKIVFHGKINSLRVIYKGEGVEGSKTVDM